MNRRPRPAASSAPVRARPQPARKLESERPQPGRPQPGRPEPSIPARRQPAARPRASRPASEPVRALLPIAPPRAVPMDRVDATAFRKALTEPETASVEAGEVTPLELERTELDAVAQVAFEYVRSGADEVARVLYAGLVALEPEVAHHRLGLGLALDHLGRTEEAARSFASAARLAPRDPVPLVNLAELALEREDFRRGRHYLERALGLPGDPAIHKKARALLAILDVRRSR